MGAFFANLQVHATEPDPAARLRAVGDRISEHLIARDYRTVPASSEADGDRTILLSTAADSKWIGVYDEDADAPDPAALSDLGEALSRDTFAIGAIVADSDTLDLSLYQDGRRTDRLRYSPGGRRPRPKRVRWEPLLKADFPGFVSSFSTDSAFAEEPLRVLAEILGIDQDCIHLGFGHRDELPKSQTATLRFLAPEGSRFFEARSGTPAYRHFAGVLRPRFVVNESLEGFGFIAGFFNEGGASRGATVLLETSPEQEKIIRVDGFRLYLDGTLDHKVESEVVRVTSDNLHFFRARFPELELPPWIDATRDVRPAEYMKLNRVFQRANIQVQVLGTALNTGEFHTRILIIPLLHPEGGAMASFQGTVLAERWW